MSYPGLIVSKAHPHREGWRIEVAEAMFNTQILTTDGVEVADRW